MIRYGLAILIAAGGGGTVGGALAAFITLIKLVPRLVNMTETHNSIRLYQNVFLIGATIFMLIYFSSFNMGISKYFAVVYGLIAGIFIGFFASALAEVLNVIPVITKKLKVKGQLRYIIIALLLGKMSGSFYYWLIYLEKIGGV